jgi:hypothetical protein
VVEDEYSRSDKLALALACLAGIMAIILFIVDKTPSAIVFLLTLMGALCIYPVLHFIRNPKGRIALLSFLMIATFLFGWHVWPKWSPSVPVFIAVNGSWYTVNQSTAGDLRIVVNIKNYSDVPLPVRAITRVYCDGLTCPGLLDNPDPLYTTIAPQDMFHVDGLVKIMNLDNLNDPTAQALFMLFLRDKIVMSETVQYNDGKRDVTYTWEGRPMSSSVDIRSCYKMCIGIVSTIRDEHN